MGDLVDFESGFEKAPVNNAENEARAEKFENAMEDAPAFAGETEQANFADAPAIISYGVNEAARKYGVEHVVEAINKFDPNSSDDPINDLLRSIGVNSKQERDDALDMTSNERAFLDNNNNPNASKNISRENAIQAIKDFQKMVRTTKADSEAFGDLNSDAINSSRGVFERAAEQAVENVGDGEDKEDIVAMFKGLENQKQKTGDEVSQDSPEQPTGDTDGDRTLSLEKMQNLAKSAEELKAEEPDTKELDKAA